MREGYIVTATVGAAFGIHGEVKVYTNNEKHGYLKKLESVVLLFPDGREKELEIVSFRVSGGTPLLKFAGYETPEKAKLLSQSKVMVPKDKAYPLQKGEVYVSDLIGLTILFEGEPVAKTVSYMEGPQSLLLEVKTPDHKSRLLPYTERCVCSLDLEKRTLVLKDSRLLQ